MLGFGRSPAKERSRGDTVVERTPRGGRREAVEVDETRDGGMNGMDMAGVVGMIQGGFAAQMEQMQTLTCEFKGFQSQSNERFSAIESRLSALELGGKTSISEDTKMTAPEGEMNPHVATKRSMLQPAPEDEVRQIRDVATKLRLDTAATITSIEQATELAGSIMKMVENPPQYQYTVEKFYTVRSRSSVVLSFDNAKARTTVRDMLMDKTNPQSWVPRYGGVSARIPKPAFQIRRDDQMHRKKEELARLLKRETREFVMCFRARTIGIDS